MSNPIGSAYYWWKDHGPNPLITAALIGALVYGKNRMLWGPSVDTLRSLGRPLGRGVFGGGEQGDAMWNQAMDNLKNNSKARHTIPAIFGLIAAGGAAWLFANPGQKNWGLLEWDAPSKLPRHSVLNTEPANTHIEIPVPDYIKKNAAYITDSWMGDIDWNKQLSMAQINPMFDIPQFDKDPYAKHMGSAIVNNAAISNHTNRPTLGNIFDSAVDKIQNKMTFGGIADVGLRSVVSNATAKMFTGALDAVVGLSPQMKQSLVDAGTWTGTISAILN